MLVPTACAGGAECSSWRFGVVYGRARLDAALPLLNDLDDIVYGSVHRQISVSGNMRRDQRLREFEHRIFGAYRFGAHDVQTDRRDPSASERSAKGGFVNHASARDIDKYRPQFRPA